MEAQGGTVMDKSSDRTWESLGAASGIAAAVLGGDRGRGVARARAAALARLECGGYRRREPGGAGGADRRPRAAPAALLPALAPGGRHRPAAAGGRAVPQRRKRAHATTVAGVV